MDDATAAISGMQDDLAGIYRPGEPMTYWRINAERNALRFRLRYLESIKATCQTCENFGHVRGFNRCSVFEDVPPADFQQTDGACESWVFDGTPF